MTLSLQDRCLLRAHAEFERAADVISPVLVAAGILRAAVALCRTVLAAGRTPDPIALQPRVLQVRRPSAP